jgi:hypothetical protein
MKASEHAVIRTIVVLASLLVHVGAAPCEITAETICKLNGAGVHCQPCKPDIYVVCSASKDFTVQTCPAGERCMRLTSSRQESHAMDQQLRS